MKNRRLLKLILTFLVFPFLVVSYRLSKETWFSDEGEDDDYPIGVSSYLDETSIDLLSRADVCKVLGEGVSFFVKNHRITVDSSDMNVDTHNDKVTDVLNSTNITTGDEWSAYSIIKKQQCSNVSDSECYNHVKVLIEWKCRP